MEVEIVLLSIFALLSIFVGVFTDDNPTISTILGGLGGVFISAVCTMIFAKDVKEPTALDVYQGKTTLEITYRDSIPVDSVVVYKK